MADIATRRIQSLETFLGFLVATSSGDERASNSSIGLKMYLGHADQPDTRIAQFALDERAELLAQGVLQSLAMMFPSPIFHSSENPNSKGER